MNRELLPAALVLFCFNFVSLFFVDKYCKFLFRYSLGPRMMKDFLDKPWFRKLARVAHIVFCIVALLIPFVIRGGSE